MFIFGEVQVAEEVLTQAVLEEQERQGIMSKKLL
tara:strand:+ start:27 stop:128 length:102 start_codon:yes stop_codon:yes gene_type:complete